MVAYHYVWNGQPSNYTFRLLSKHGASPCSFHTARMPDETECQEDLKGFLLCQEQYSQSVTDHMQEHVPPTFPFSPDFSLTTLKFPNFFRFLADRTNGRTIATVLRPSSSSVCDVMYCG